MKKLIAAALAVAIMLLCCACGKKTDSDLKYVQDKGILIVGVTDYEPMDYKDDNGNWTGFDAEFAKAVGEKLGVEVQFVEIDWDNKFFELDSKAIDCIWNGMTITDEVKLNASVSNPYVTNAQTLVTTLENSGNDSVELAQHLKVAAEAGSAGEASAKDLGFDCTAVQSQSAALMEVAAGTADACIIDITMANAMTGEGTSYPDLTIAMVMNSEEYGIGFRKDSDLTAKVNDIMKDLMTDGTLDALAQKYSLTLVK